MNGRKKVTAVSLYLKDLNRRELSGVYDFQIASSKFKKLSVQDRDYYEVQAKKINDRSKPVEYTTQRDTLGRNLKDLSDMDERRTEWFANSIKRIKKISKHDDIMDRDFYIALVSGAEFNRAADFESCYCTSEITFIRFSFSEGIKKELILFPDPLAVPPGFRQSLYEDLEESVGWKPDTFRNNHPINYCIEEIRSFFKKRTDEPIFVPTNNQQIAVGMSLYYLYKEANRICPWIESFQDWGLNTRIYQFEYLVSEVMQARYAIMNPKEDPGISVTVVLDYWFRIMMDVSAESCERHKNHGLPNQCCTNMIKKYLYISYVIMSQLIGQEMLSISDLVSPEFYRNLDLILPASMQDNDHEDQENNMESHRNEWSDYYERSGIEDVINTIGGITINGRGANTNAMNIQSANAKILEIGRGRGIMKNNMSIKNEKPGRKIRLPNVIC